MKVASFSAIVAVASASLCKDAGESGVPADVVDMSPWKLQLPITGAECGTSSTVCEIEGSELTSYESDYFYIKSGKVRFCVPLNGAHTDGTHYARSELRELYEWEVPTGSAKRTLTGSVYVKYLAQKDYEEDKTGVIIGQIHGDTSKSFAQLVKLRWNGKHNYVDVQMINSDGSSGDYKQLSEELSLGDKVEYSISIQGSTVTTCVNGKCEDYDYSYIVAGENGYYFKAGSYCQNSGDVDTEGCMVEFSDIKVDHQEAAVEV